MRIILADVSVSMCDAFEKHCGDLPDVEIHRGSILEVKADIIVSPANSFGFMNGGIDALYTKHFGPQVQRRLQEKIRDSWYGELPIGSADFVSTMTDEEDARGEPPADKPLGWMIAAPTMRTPTNLPRNTINPYLAARAALIVSKYRLGDDYSIVMPGMGTGVGDVKPIICAKQIRTAIQRICIGYDFPKSLGVAYDVPIDTDPFGA